MAEPMTEDVARRLVALNTSFYKRFAEPFAASRSTPQPGFERLLSWTIDSANVLDVGCGDGRFGRFLGERGQSIHYTGVDSSEALLKTAASINGHFLRRDLSRPDCLVDLGEFDLVVCLSTLQHIPGRANRARLLIEMKNCLCPGGRLALANWQFLDSPRQRRKIRPWSEVGLEQSSIEPGDYLLSWKRGGFGLRYVAALNESTTRELAEAAGLGVIEQFRSDGREGMLNLYTLLAG